MPTKGGSIAANVVEVLRGATNAMLNGRARTMTISGTMPPPTSFLNIYPAASNMCISLQLQHRLVHEVFQLVIACPPLTPPSPRRSQSRPCPCSILSLPLLLTQPYSPLHPGSIVPPLIPLPVSHSWGRKGGHNDDHHELQF
jgi:hypothetical protein